MAQKFIEFFLFPVLVLIQFLFRMTAQQRKKAVGIAQIQHHAVEHLGLFTGCPADTHGVIHYHAGKCQRKGEFRRGIAHLFGNGNGDGADKSRMRTGHTASADHPLCLQNSVLQIEQQGFDKLSGKP